MTDASITPAPLLERDPCQGCAHRQRCATEQVACWTFSRWCDEAMPKARRPKTKPTGDTPNRVAYVATFCERPRGKHV